MIFNLIFAYNFNNVRELKASQYLCRLKIHKSEFSPVYKGV
jgi:hypothetical protein